ncbi:unnamed protein product [Knipowitschia caucasica]
MSPLSGCWCLTWCLITVSALLPPPQNVRLCSHNMDLWLRWNPPLKENQEEVLYSTQLKKLYLGDSGDFSACVNISELACELSDPGLGLDLLEFGQYRASVQAQCGQERSVWVDSQVLTMDRDTVIGPPAVTLTPQGAGLEVSLTEPLLLLSTMTRVYGSTGVRYNVSFWPRGLQQEVSQVLDQQSRLVLPDLLPWTEYCVQVAVHLDPEKNDKTPETSAVQCERTAADPSSPWVTVALSVGGVAVAVALLAIAVGYRRQICHFLCPQERLPQSLQLCPEGPQPLSSEPEEVQPLTLRQEEFPPGAPVSSSDGAWRCNSLKRCV